MWSLVKDSQIEMPFHNNLANFFSSPGVFNIPRISNMVINLKPIYYWPLIP